MLSFARVLRSSSVHPALATPMTGTSSVPRRTRAWRAGKIFLCARSPVAPKKTSASLSWVIAAGRLAEVAARRQSTRVNCHSLVLICCTSVVTLAAMGQRGQASVEWVGVVALVAVVIASVAAFALPTQIGPAVVRQIHRALCIVSGGVCDLDQRPCVTAANSTEDEAHVNLGILRVGRHELILREHQSDGSVFVTYLHDTGAGFEVGGGGDISIGKRLGAMCATARAALLATLGGGETWVFPDARSADRGMSYLSEGKSPPDAKRAQRITQHGVQVSADASLSRETVSGELHLDARLVEGTVVDERDGRRTHVITHRGEAGAIVRISEESGASGQAMGEERLAVTTDAQGRP